MPQNFIVVIRSSGERTLDLCQKLVRDQAGDAKMFVVEEKPFKKTFETSLKLGIQNGAEWLITVDADMLIVKGAIDKLRSEAEKMPDNYLQLQGQIYDKITGTIRKAGPRIYRGEYLEKLLKISEESEDTIRPESASIKKMADAGHPSRYIIKVICYHDFLQYYRDLYRKAYVHSVKHRELVPIILENCLQDIETDKDQEVILKAVIAGLNENREVAIDTRLFSENAEKFLAQMNLYEKPSLGTSGDEIKEVELKYHQYLNQLNEYYLTSYFDDKTNGKVMHVSLRDKIKDDGILNVVFGISGNLLKRTGNYLHNKIKR